MKNQKAPVNAIEFEHACHDHCESGTAVNLLNHAGLKLSEPMIFGIGAGIYFVHASFLRAFGAPVTTFRYFVGGIFKQVTQALNIRFKVKSFFFRSSAMKALDSILEKGIPVGLVTNMNHLDFMPEVIRFELTGHNLVVFAKEGDIYHVSDPIIDFPVQISREQLAKARFGKGLMNPLGKMYYIVDFPSDPPLKQAVISSIQLVCKRMLNPLLPGFGSKGIHVLADKIKEYPVKYSQPKAAKFLRNVVRMQEVIGTGGGGYRILYSKFLKEASQVLAYPPLYEQGEALEKIGNDWRMLALQMGRCAKNKQASQAEYTAIADQLHQIAEAEIHFFEQLKKTMTEYLC